MWSSRRGEPRVKNASKLYVQPSELASKLVKEMEDDKIARGSRVSVRNRYTIYLCREDYERLRAQEEVLLSKLEAHLTRHMRSRGYETPGAIGVKIAPDPDLRLGHFGIYAERESPSGVVKKGRPSSLRSVRAAGTAAGTSVAAPGSLAAHAAAARAAAARAAAAGSPEVGLDRDHERVARPGDDSVEEAVLDLPAELAWNDAESAPPDEPPLQPDPSTVRPPGAAGPAADPRPAAVPEPRVDDLWAEPGSPEVRSRPATAEESGAAAGRAAAAGMGGVTGVGMAGASGAAAARHRERPSRPAPKSPQEQVGASTEIISPDDAAEYGLVTQTIVLKANNQEYVFHKGRIIVGRSRDVDFRIDNADVSRRHAAFYWSDGDIMVKDLGSTNGTMVNGYPVDSTIVRPGDVVLVGDCFITVESR